MRTSTKSQIYDAVHRAKILRRHGLREFRDVEHYGFRPVKGMSKFLNSLDWDKSEKELLDSICAFYEDSRKRETQMRKEREKRKSETRETQAEIFPFDPESVTFADVLAEMVQKKAEEMQAEIKDFAQKIKELAQLYSKELLENLQR